MHLGKQENQRFISAIWGRRLIALMPISEEREEAIYKSAYDRGLQHTTVQVKHIYTHTFYI